LDISNKVTHAKQRTLYFYDVHRKNESFGQVDFDETNYKATWSFSVRKNWFIKLQRECLDDWFRLAASGKKLKRAENSVFSIKITSKNFQIGYEIDGFNEHPNDVIDLPHKAIFEKGTSTSFMTKSKDLAPVLYNLAELQINGDIKFSGNASVLIIEFETLQGNYLIAIPTVHGATMKRDATQFKIYAEKAPKIEKK